MAKIDLTTKFFHGVGWDTESDAHKVELLKDILSERKIFSSKDLAVKNNCDFAMQSNKIFLSVYPYGIYANKFPGDGYNLGYTGYDMTIDSFYFILSRKIANDFNLEVGAYPLECTVDGPIDLNRYLVGIGNAGYNIDFNLLMCYYYTLYLKGIISQKIMLNKIRACINPGGEYLQFQDDRVIWEIINNWANLSLEFSGDTHYRRIIETVHEKVPEQFVNPKCYNAVKSVCEECDFPVKMYDFEGYCIEPDKQLVRVRRMQQYIRKNSSYKK